MTAGNSCRLGFCAMSFQRLRRLRSPEPLPEGGFDFAPFREDFEFIVRKLKQERVALASSGGAARPPFTPAASISTQRMPTTSSDRNHNLADSNGDAIIEIDAPLLEAELPRRDVYGQQYSILESSMVNELYEQRRKTTQYATFAEAYSTLSAALRLLVPSTRRGWLTLVGLCSLMIILWSVVALRGSTSTMHVNAWGLEWDRRLWWSFVTRALPLPLAAG